MIDDYDSLLDQMVELLEASRYSAAQRINALMTATYWEVGRKIVEGEQGGERRAEYGATLIKRLAEDLSTNFGKGFSERNLAQMRRFYLEWQILQMPSAKFDLESLSQHFPLPWSHYVRLMSVKEPGAREFYEEEAFRAGWTEKQLKRQIETQYYERFGLSTNKAEILKSGRKQRREDITTPEEEIKSPYIFEFLGLRDEYSEGDLEDALIEHLEKFLLELGEDFTFQSRQKRLRIGSEWYRVDLVFFNRRLRCLMLIDLKLGKLTPGDVGQMNAYVNYARKHWILPEENPPIGLILCSQKDDAVVEYAMENLSDTVLAAEYKVALPDRKTLVEEIKKARRVLEFRASLPPSENTD